MEGFAVSEVVQDEVSATAITDDGREIEGIVIVGADGYRSVVRSAISPARPHARYAGYMLWRGLVSEGDLPSGTPWPRSDHGVGLIHRGGYRLIAYPVAGPEGLLQPGKRLISFAWYDPGREGLLQEHHCLSGTGEVLASLSREKVMKDVRQELCDLALAIWPPPWRNFILHALETQQVFGTPVAEYFPERLHLGRLAILGDAAHVVSPMTGKGFVTSILDAEVFADCLHAAHDQSRMDVDLAISCYAESRLPKAQELVTFSMQLSHAYLRKFGRP